MNKTVIPPYNPPLSSEFQNRISHAKNNEELMSALAEWAMKTGICNNIDPQVYDKLLLIRRGVTL